MLTVNYPMLTINHARRLTVNLLTLTINHDSFVKNKRTLTPPPKGGCVKYMTSYVSVSVGR